MSTSNKELTRADIALQQLAANGGILSPEQSNQFIDYVVEQPTLLANVRVERMTAPEKKINRIGFGQRIMRAARQEGSANDDGSNDRYVRKADRSAPTTGQLTISTREVIAEVRIPYEVLEDNIEQAGLETHIIRLIAERAALDFEEKALWGDTALAVTDPYLGQQDGWMKLANANVLDWQNKGINPALFTQALLTIPQRYLRFMGQMRGIVSEAARLHYLSWMQTRGTALGDAAVTGNLPLNASGLLLLPSPGMALGPAGTQGKALITPLKNLIWGVKREITIETDRDIRSREHIIVVTARVGMQIDDKSAAVRADNVGNFADASLPVRVTNSSTSPVLTKETA